MTIENFEFQSLAADVHFGPGKVSQLPGLIGDKKAFVIAEERQQAIVDQLSTELGAKNVVPFREVGQHVPAGLVAQAAAVYVSEGCEILVAIGGGSTIGLAKALALETSHPIIAVPTTYAGSEMTNIWGITSAAGAKTTGRDARVLPAHVIYDPDLTITLPKKLAATSAMHAMAHLMEAIYAPDVNPVTYITSLYGMKQMMIGMLILSREKKLSANANNLLLLGAFLGGKGLREVAMSLHHKAAHVLSDTFALEHSHVHTVLQPYVLEYQWGSLVNKTKEDLKQALMNPYPPMALYDAAKVMDAPFSLKEIGFKAEDIEKAVDIMLEQPYANPAPLDRDKLIKMMQRAYDGKLLGSE